MGDSKLNITINADDNASPVFKGLGGILDGLGGGVGSLAGGIGGLAGMFMSGGVFSLGMDFAKNAVEGLRSSFASFYDEASERQEGISQLDAVLKSTGGSAGVTKDQVTKLAESFSGLTKFSDDAVLGGENLLLTFTSIGKDVFPDATKTMLDMSQALGQDLKSSSIQLGKALQDPITGVTALKRVGVNFTDTQMDMIKNMVNSNNLMGAQKLILAELGREFGGSAEAAGKTASGMMTRITNGFNDAKEMIGSAFMPALENVLGSITNKFMPVVASLAEKIAPVIGKIADSISTVLSGVVDKASTIIPQLFAVIQQMMSGNFSGFKSIGTLLFGDSAIGNGINEFVSMLTSISQTAKEILPILKGVFSVDMSEFKFGLNFIMLVFNTIKGFIKEHILPAIDQFTTKLSDSGIGNLFTTIKKAIDSIDFTSWEGFFISVFGADMGIKIINITNQIEMFANKIIYWFTNSIVPMIQKFVPWFINLIKNDLGPTFSKTFAEIQTVMESLNKFWSVRGKDITETIRIIGVALGVLIDIVGGILLSTVNLALGLISAAFKLMAGDAGGALKDIGQGLGDFFDGILRLVGTNLDSFTKMWKDIFSMASEIISAFAGKIVGFFTGIWDSMLGVGKNIVGGIQSGISNAWGNFTDWLRGMITSIPNFVSGILGIHSPSTVFADIGKNMMAGLQQGIDTNSALPTVSLKSSATTLISTANSQLSAGNYIAPSRSNGNITIAPVIQSALSFQTEAQAVNVLTPVIVKIIRDQRAMGNI